MSAVIAAIIVSLTAITAALIASATAFFTTRLNLRSSQVHDEARNAHELTMEQQREEAATRTGLRLARREAYAAFAAKVSAAQLEPERAGRNLILAEIAPLYDLIRLISTRPVQEAAVAYFNSVVAAPGQLDPYQVINCGSAFLATARAELGVVDGAA